MVPDTPTASVTNPASTSPLVASWVSELRDPNCPMQRFRTLVGRISTQLAVDAAAHLRWGTAVGASVLGPAELVVADGPAPVVVPVLRAGLSMLDAMVDVLDFALVAPVGVARDHDTFEPHCYLPAGPQVAGSPAIICDPMLATGGSVRLVGELLEAAGAGPVIVCSVLAAPEGLSMLTETHPDWVVCAAAVDERLDERGYILPGLGDAGDRWAGLERPF